MPISLRAISGGVGLRVAPTTSYNAACGGLFGSVVTGLNINTKATVLTLTGRWVVYHIVASSLGSGGSLFVSLTVDGRVICNDLNTGIPTPDALIYAADTTLSNGGGIMPPLLVEQSLTLQLQKTGVSAQLSFLAIPLEG